MEMRAAVRWANKFKRMTRSDVGRLWGVVKPFLRWAGSKRQHLTGLMENLPNWTGKYIEPFAGSACLFWRLEPHQAVLGDLNTDLINCYQRVAAEPEAVFAVYSGSPNEAGEYYRLRTAMHEETDPIQRAGYFIYLNRYCFNGLYRTDRKGRFNVPYGGLRSGALPHLNELKEYSERLRQTTLISGDFEDIVDKYVGHGDLVYLDPPYFSSKRRVFTEYTGASFGEKDLERFDSLLERIDRAGAAFIATYLDGDDIRQIAKKWKSRKVDVLRRVAGFSTARKQARELVFSNAEVAA